MTKLARQYLRLKLSLHLLLLRASMRTDSSHLWKRREMIFGGWFPQLRLH